MFLLRQFGLLIGRCPLRVMLTTLAMALPLLSYFALFKLDVETDVRRGFAHRNGRASKEMEAFGEYYNVSMEGLEIMLVFVRHKGALHEERTVRVDSALLAEVERLDRLLKGLAVQIDGRALTLAQLQTSRGDVNSLFKAYKWAHDRQETLARANFSLDAQIQLGYPVSRIYGFDVPLSSHFFGVDPSSSAANGTFVPFRARTIALWYMFEGRGERMRKALAGLELQFFDRVRTFSAQLDVYVYADEIANFEMMRGGKSTIRLVSIGIGAMVLFMLIAFWDYSWMSQVILICMSMLSPSLSIVVAFALIGWFGLQFNAVMSVMPFLVLGIGVDNAFLLLHSWRKWTPKEKDCTQRMGIVVAEMGPSIAITSITNGLAFGIGFFSPSSVMSTFCLCTTVAIFLDLFFEFTLFAPCLPLIRWTSSANSRMQTFRVSICRRYARFLVSRWAKLGCVSLLAFLYAMSFLGIARMEANFEPQKTFLADSPLQKSIAVFNQVIVEHAPISFIVFRPPDISDRVQLRTFMHMVAELEELPNTAGPNSTDLWLRGYLEYDKRKNGATHGGSGEYTPSYALVPRYLRERKMDDKRVVEYRVDANGSLVSLDRFMFVLSRRGQLSWLQRAHFVDKLRTLVDRHPQFNVSVFDYDSTIYDLILIVKTEMLKAVLVTLTCMALVCFFVIPNIRHTGIATFSVLSISFTLLGSLGWWGLDMDPVTMINVLMAIGFSVDFSAHICFHFNKAQQSSAVRPADQSDAEFAERQLEAILKAVGRPMLEAACSTVICVSPLFFLSIYIMEAFGRTVLCVGTLGTVHGLFIVPVLLSLEPSRGPPQKCTAPVAQPLLMGSKSMQSEEEERRKGNNTT